MDANAHLSVKRPAVRGMFMGNYLGRPPAYFAGGLPGERKRENLFLRRHDGCRALNYHLTVLVCADGIQLGDIFFGNEL